MRYSRQTILPQIGEEGQKKLKNSTVAIIGIGALGTVSAELLARAGIGKLILVDRDVVELSNLPRQTLYDETDIGKAKAVQAKEKLSTINSDITLEAHPIDLDFRNIDILKHVDIILDGTDNLETRYLINEYAIREKKPWIYAAGIQTKGYVLPILPDGPCLKCFLDNKKAQGTCETRGVLNTLIFLVASVEATTAIKVLLNTQNPGTLISLDIWHNQINSVTIGSNPSCSACAGEFEYITGTRATDIIKLCGQFQIKHKVDLPELASELRKLGKVTDLGYALNFGRITAFGDRALIKASTKEQARTLHSKYIGD